MSGQRTGRLNRSATHARRRSTLRRRSGREEGEVPGGLARELGRWLLERSENVTWKDRQPMHLSHRTRATLPVGRRPRMERRYGGTTERRNVGNRAGGELDRVTPAEGAVGAARVRDLGNGPPYRSKREQQDGESFTHGSTPMPFRHSVVPLVPHVPHVPHIPHIPHVPPVPYRYSSASLQTTVTA
jgi:hypothetical protein